MICDNCGKEISMWNTGYSIGHLTVCSDCHKNEYEELKAKAEAEDPEFKPEPTIDPKELNRIILTTETNTKDLVINDRLGVISSESALGMNIFRDLFTNVRDIVGGQSVSTQRILKDLKSTVFQDLKEQAYNLDADAVIAINLDYSEFSGGGRSMLFLVATGTAVKLNQEIINQNQA